MLPFQKKKKKLLVLYLTKLDKSEILWKRKYTGTGKQRENQRKQSMHY